VEKDECIRKAEGDSGERDECIEKQMQKQKQNERERQILGIKRKMEKN